MSELSELTAQRESILSELREIEASCEGTENPNNAQRMHELNTEQAQLTAQRNEIQARLGAVQGKLSAVNEEIANVSGSAVDRILEAIKGQRWYFFKNNKYILMDRDTGLLWANLDYFNYSDGTIGNFNEVSGVNGWAIPTNDEMKRLVSDKTFPFHKGYHYYIKEKNYWRTSTGGIDLNDLNTYSSQNGHLIPCNLSLIANTTYAKDVDPSNHNYSERERLQFTLDLFTHNNLWPICLSSIMTKSHRYTVSYISISPN